MVGIDVSASSAKLIELTRHASSGEFTLERCAIERFESGWMTDGNIENVEAVTAAVRRVVRKSRTKAKAVALSLPTSAAISKKVVLPANLTEREMELQVEVEAGQYIPFALDDVSLDFCVIGPNASSVEDVDVMISASRREKVEKRQDLADAINLTAEIVDVDCYASRLALGRVIDSIPGLDPEGTLALFEIGGVASELQVLRNDDLLYERELVFGGRLLTQEIARQYGITEDEAETKKRAGDLPADYADVVLAPFVTDLAQEVDRALKLFFASTPNNNVDWILLAGGSGGLHGLAAAVQQETSFPCRVLDPFVGMRLGPQVRREQLAREAPSYLTACGLAMRRFLR